MKTLNTIIITIAATAAFSLKADPNLISGPRIGKNTPAVVLASPRSGVQDPNLVAEFPTGGSRAVSAAHPVVSTGVKDPDTLAAVKKCGMTPKSIDTPACAKHCQMAGMK